MGNRFSDLSILEIMSWIIIKIIYLSSWAVSDNIQEESIELNAMKNLIKKLIKVQGHICGAGKKISYVTLIISV